MTDDPHAAPEPAADSTNKPNCPKCGSEEDTTALTPCGHRVCVPCMHRYLETQIAEGIDSPTCPWQDTAYGPDGGAHAVGPPCNALIRVQQVKRLVTASTRFKFEALRARNLGDYVRECPYCSYLQECDGPESPQCVCEACGETYCFRHGRLHPYSSCTIPEDKVERICLFRGKVPCPECPAFVHVHGYRYVICTNCETGFCCLCGDVVTDAKAHYGPSGTVKCRGKYTDDYGQSNRNSVWATYRELMSRKFSLDYKRDCGHRAWAAIGSIIIVLPSALLAIPIAPIWWARRRYEPVWIAYVSTTRFIMKIIIDIIHGFLELLIALVQETPLGIAFAVIVLAYEGVKWLIRACCGPRGGKRDKTNPPYQV